MYQYSIKGAYLCPGAKPYPGAPFYRSSYSLTTGTNDTPGKKQGGTFYRDTTLGENVGRKLNDILDSSVIVVEGQFDKLYDGDAYTTAGSNKYAYYTQIYLTLSDTDRSKSAAYEHHNAYANFLFKDMHVASCRAGTPFSGAIENLWKIK